MAPRTYPEINALNLRQAREAYKLGKLNLDSLTPAGRADLLPRLEALAERIYRLQWTGKRVRGIAAAR